MWWLSTEAWLSWYFSAGGTLSFIFDKLKIYTICLSKITSNGGDQVSIVDPDGALAIIEEKLEPNTLEEIAWKSEDHLTVIESDEVKEKGANRLWEMQTYH